jgi:hypothetical protein
MLVAGGMVGVSWCAEDQLSPEAAMNWRSLIVLTVSALPAPAAAHDWYTGLRAPDGASCCNQTDCHELDWSQVRRAPDGELELLIEGHWLPVPFRAILSIKSPDGHVHACWPAGGKRLTCVILPPEA